MEHSLVKETIDID